jgi:hypothetical protein
VTEAAQGDGTIIVTKSGATSTAHNRPPERVMSIFYAALVSSGIALSPVATVIPV